jgi:predicted ATPase/class 3 adenylate cyclase
MEITNSFGYWIRRQRKALDLTQQVLAERVGCSVAAIKKIESDERRPSRQIAERLAGALGVSTSQREIFLEAARGVRPVDQLLLAHEPTVPTPLPRGIVTFLFTDIEDSTKLWESAPEKMKVALQRHHAILQEAISSKGGTVFQIIGDAFCAAFPTAPSAVSAAATAQRGLYEESWDTPFPIRVRMGVHTGEAELISNTSPTGGYASNQTLNRVARILKAGHGGQVLFSLVTKELLKDSLPANTEVRDMGEYHLKNLVRPEHLFQLNIIALPSAFPPLITLDATHHNLPVQLTSFIGREKEQAEILKLIIKYRLVTLVGAGGVGKTRLSLKVGEAVLGEYADGVWLVELASVSDPLLIPRTIAIAIGLRDEPHRPVIDMLLLCDYLHDKKLLLILDNCEHLIEACAQLVDWLLHACLQIHILASSREALGIAGETSYFVPSLQLPDMQNLPTLESISQYEAIRLFMERASAATQHFTMTNENASSIAQICQRLDGMPLAIELAAGKIRALSAGQIAQRLDDRFHLLTGGSRTALPRHQTLQAAIEWSYNLLSPNEQTLFRRLAVFVNGWTLEATEFVCSEKGTNTKDALKTETILDLLTQLVNKSLVMTEERNGEVRYQMLETIRQFGSAKLQEANESESCHDRHLEYFLQLAEAAEPHLRRVEQIEWLKRLDADHENLRAALAWAMEKPSAEPALSLAGALGIFWDMRAYWLEGARWLVQALNKEWDRNRKLEKAARAKALYRRADFAANLDELDILKTSAESALALCEEVKDLWGVAYSRAMVAGHLLGQMADLEASKLLLEQSLNEFQKLGDAWGESFVLPLLGETLGERLENRQRAIVLARASGDRYRIALLLLGYAGTTLFVEGKLNEVENVLQEAEQLFTEIGSSSGINQTRLLRAYIFFMQRQLEEAKTEAKLYIEYSRRVGEKQAQASCLTFLGLISEIENDLQNAVEYQQKSLDLTREVGSPRNIAWSLMNLGRLRYQEGNREVAIQYVKDSLQILKKGVVSQGKTAYSLSHLGGLFAETKSRVAIQFLSLSGTLAQNLPHPRDPIFDKPYFDRSLAAARAKLSEAEFTSAWEAGLNMTIDEAIALAWKTVDET